MGLSGISASLTQSCNPLHSLVCMRESVPKYSIKNPEENFKHTLRYRITKIYLILQVIYYEQT